MEFGEKRSTEEFSGGGVMTFAQFAGQSKCSFAVAGSGRPRHLEQLVGDPRHSADHHDGPLFEPTAHDLRHARDRFGVPDRSAAKLHDNAAVSHWFLNPTRTLTNNKNPHPSNRAKGGAPAYLSSVQIALVLEQFRIQQCRTGGTTNGVVRKHGEFPVEHTTRPEATNRRRHPLAKLDVKTRLRTIGRLHVANRELRRRRIFPGLWNAAEFAPSVQNLGWISFSLQFD